MIAYNRSAERKIVFRPKLSSANPVKGLMVTDAIIYDDRTNPTVLFDAWSSWLI